MRTWRRAPALAGAAVALGVAASGTLAVLAAARRRLQHALVDERAARARSEFIGRAGDLLEAPQEPQAMLDQIVRLAVPELAHACLVDLVESGEELRGAAVFAGDPAAAEAIAALRQRVPVDITGAQLVAVAARTGEPHLVRDLSALHLPGGAGRAPHLDLIVRLGYRSALVVPLVARGRTIGVLSLLRDGDDEPFAETTSTSRPRSPAVPRWRSTTRASSPS